MNAIVPQQFGQLSQRFAGAVVEDDLSAGVSSGYGLIGYRGKVWSLRHRGQDTQLMRDDGDGPRGSIEVVILKASTHISKIYYEGGWVEGSNSPPDCFSTNGVTPDPASTKKQHSVCASCPKNAWGSRITPSGKAGKACSDNKRLAVVPAGDINNDVFGGPMLLRVPAASLQDLAQFGQKMQKLGYPYYAIATRIAFDQNESYPKFVFSAIRPLTDAEAEQVLASRDTDQVGRILAEASEFAIEPEQTRQEELKGAFEQPPEINSPSVQPGASQETQPSTDIQPPSPQPGNTSSGVGGFGGSAASPARPIQQPTQQGQQPTVQQDAAPVANNSDFEAKLDAELDALLGPTAS